MEDIKINVNDIVDYTYYDESGKKVAVLNQNKLKDLLHTDYVVFFEPDE